MLNYRLQVLSKRCLLMSMAMILTACSYWISSATDDFGQNLTKVMLNQEDPEMVAAAIPAYLMLLEALNEQNGGQQALLAATAELYSAYISLIPENPKRSQILANKAMAYALRSVCLHKQSFCQIKQLKYPEFAVIIAQTDEQDIAALYTLGAAWAAWIQANRSDWNAIAQLAQVKTLMQRIIALDETYKQGGAHVYLGVMGSLIPPAMGGDPESARQHFEQALLLSERRNLMIKVVYARHYARMLFDRDLHDRLLTEVMAADAQQPELTLINSVAKKQAQALLDSADDYF